MHDRCGHGLRLGPGEGELDTGKGVGLMGKCDGCKYYVSVVGQRQSHRLCVAGVQACRSGVKRLSKSIDVMDLVLLLGKEKLESMLGHGGENLVACQDFEEMN